MPEYWSLCLLQGIFPAQGSNPGLLHCRRILYQLSHKGSPANSWVCLNSFPSSQCCYLTISFSAIPFSFCLQSFQHQCLSFLFSAIINCIVFNSINLILNSRFHYSYVGKPLIYILILYPMTSLYSLSGLRDFIVNSLGFST